MEIENKEEVNKFDFFVEPGHFYSPLVDNKNFSRIQSYLPKKNEIELNHNKQVKLLQELSAIGHEFPKTKNSMFRYYSENDQFGDGDAFIYSGIIRKFSPSKIVEIGSGYSSAVALDVVSKGKTELIFIEPYPDRLKQLIRPDEQLSLHEKKVQEIDLEIFAKLKENDIVFIDSSHVAKTNSDLLWEIFEILPILKKGVLIHFHDIFWPFEYPESWIRDQNRSWNEVYFLRAFLAYNSRFEIILFNDYLNKIGVWAKTMPISIENPGGSLWLRVSIDDNK